MPSARTARESVTWQTAPPPQTPLQRSAFLDMCVQWLIREPDGPVEDDALVPRTTWDGPTTPEAGSSHDGFGLRKSEVPEVRQCAMCGGDDALRTVTANPFAHRYCIVVCATCHAP
jgi:hypothetical protein